MEPYRNFQSLAMNSRKGINATVILSSKFLVSNRSNQKEHKKQMMRMWRKGFHKTKIELTNDQAIPFLGV